MQGSDKWYYSGVDGTPHGPWAWKVMQQYVREGSIRSETLIWAPHLGSEWRRADTIEGLFESQAAGSAPPPLPVARVAHVRKINNHLGFAIAMTVLCCLPTGIVAILYATSVEGLAAQGKIAAARRAANKAKTWAWISMPVGLVLGLAYVIFQRSLDSL